MKNCLDVIVDAVRRGDDDLFRIFVLNKMPMALWMNINKQTFGDHFADTKLRFQLACYKNISLVGSLVRTAVLPIDVLPIGFMELADLVLKESCRIMSLCLDKIIVSEIHSLIASFL